MSIDHEYLRKLEKSPRHKQTRSNAWADYIELVCLASVDDEVTEVDIIDRLSGRTSDLSEDSEEELIEIKGLEDETDESDEPSRRAEIPDKWVVRVKDYFKVLSIRESLHEDYYPFSIVGDTLKRKVDITEEHCLYIYLLLCSNLYLFDEDIRNELANTFEIISFNSFKNFLPKNAIAYLFGKNNYNKNKRFSKGTFWNKLNRLRRDIHERNNPHISKSEYSDHHTGDEGLDLVAWVPSGDDLSSSLIYFAQCACTYDFVEKQHSSSSQTWLQKIAFKNPPANSTFIPHCYRNGEGNWIKSSDIISTFLVDRKRILNFYNLSDKIKFSNFPAYNLVGKILTLKEDVV